VVRLVDAAGIHPEVIQTIPPSLLCAELDLAIPCLALSVVLQHVMEGHFLTIYPCMREYRIWGDRIIADQVFRPANLVVTRVVQQSHYVTDSGCTS
jgi:hypothetical protein